MKITLFMFTKENCKNHTFTLFDISLLIILVTLEEFILNDLVIYN